MPRLLVVLFCLVMLAASKADAEQAFPYKAYAMADDVEVRSGPGEDFYPTDKLHKGQEVEVYRSSGRGWCAVKPPESSFSWITGRALKLDDDNLAVVTQDEVAARVGSSLSDMRDVIQVRMHKDEVVEILDSKDSPDGKPQVWYKIAPPSGEFRFVLEKDLDREKPRDDAGGIGTADSSLQDRLDPQSPDAGKNISSKEFQAELDRIDMELSIMVIEDPTVWSFDAMRIRAESLLEQADSAMDRGKTRLLINRIARFDDIKRRYDSMPPSRDKNTPANRFIAGLKSTMEKAASIGAPAAGSASTADLEKQFDGIGQLQQVFAPKLGAPRFALVDEAGNVRYYVTPAPGVNLQNYVGSQVGITGTRGYMPEQRAQHITARHVSSLENRIR